MLQAAKVPQEDPQKAPRSDKNLQLDSTKNNSHSFDWCPNSPGYFRGVYEKREKCSVVSIRGNVPCKSWQCDYCRPKNLKKLRARIFNSEMVQNYRDNGFRDKHSQKFLTLTYPGKDHREKYTVLEAYEQMTDAFDKLTRALKKKRGDYKYLRVCEPQADGYPHLHVVLVGRSIARKEILQDIESLWREKYGMGFVKMNVITKSLEHAIRYITKYMSKNPVSMGKNKRIFTASKGGLQKMKKKSWLDKAFYFGTVKDGKDGEIVVEEREIKICENGKINALQNHMAEQLIKEMFGMDLWEEKIKIVRKK